MVLAAGLVHLGATRFATGATWAAYIVLCACAHITLCQLYRQAHPPDEKWRVWAGWFTAISFAEGVGWGWASVLLADHGNFSVEMLILVVSLNIAGAAIPAFGSYLPAFFAFFIPATVPCVYWGIVLATPFPEATTMMLLMLLFVVAMGGIGLRHNRNFEELVNLRIQTEALATDLRHQKEVAEQANLAKSSFLAAASHDLRQPVHAIGMLVGALREVALPDTAIALVERIEESTLAMDGLFNAILDISRLDAGIVDVSVKSFPIQPLLRRICNDYAAEAEAKSVVLTLHYCSAIVATDPLLMERIVRNLVSNAVRHTVAGRIVVGCRRSADRVRVEVWDTGPGVPFAERDRIFQEYVQLRNPERDRAMELGLGLAIVRRLSDLLGCPIALRSQLGQGSCFSVDMPRSSAKSVVADLPIDARLPVLRGLVLVIDDEIAIRDAMESLLKGWGYQVLAAGSGAEMLARLQELATKPILIICDYRLRDGENGIDVVRQLQTHCEDGVPAMLITGDTAADRLVDAQASGLLLMHKPVPNSKLRAAIVNLVAASRATGVMAVK